MILRTQKGFTLTEAMVSVAIFIFLMTGLYVALSAGGTSVRIQNSSLAAQREARNALNAMSRELRMVDDLDVTQSSSAVDVSFTHPTEGSVSYAWINDISNTNTNRIIRTSSASTRTIARNISALSITNNADNVVINVTATGEPNTLGTPESIQLIKKIAKR